MQNQQAYAVKDETRKETKAIRTCHQRSSGRVISVVHQFQFITTRWIQRFTLHAGSIPSASEPCVLLRSRYPWLLKTWPTCHNTTWCMSHAEPCMCAACSLCARIAIPCNCKQLAVRHTGLSSDGRWHVSVLIVCQTRKLAVTYDATLTSPLTWQDRWANDAYRKQVSNYRWVIGRVCVISACTDSGSSVQRHCPLLNWQAAVYSQ